MKLIIEHDESAPNPRKDFDQSATFALFHNRYLLPNESGISRQDFNSWQSLYNLLKKRCDAAYILPVYMLDHSGLTFSTNEFPCKWDSGQIGFAYITRDNLLEYGYSRMTAGCAKKCAAIIEGELAQYDNFSSGNVYAYTVEDDYGTIIDQCGGFFGSDHVASGLKDCLPTIMQNLVEVIGQGAGEAAISTELPA